MKERKTSLGIFINLKQKEKKKKERKVH